MDESRRQTRERIEGAGEDRRCGERTMQAMQWVNRCTSRNSGPCCGVTIADNNEQYVQTLSDDNAILTASLTPPRA